MNIYWELCLTGPFWTVKKIVLTVTLNTLVVTWKYRGSMLDRKDLEPEWRRVVSDKIYISCLFLKQSVCNRFRAETEGKKGTVKLNNEHVSKRLRQRRYDPIVWNTNVSEKKRSKKSVVKEKRNRWKMASMCGSSKSYPAINTGSYYRPAAYPYQVSDKIRKYHVNLLGYCCSAFTNPYNCSRFNYVLIIINVLNTWKRLERSKSNN